MGMELEWEWELSLDDDDEPLATLSLLHCVNISF